MLDLGVLKFLRMVSYSSDDYLKTGVTSAQNGAISAEMAQGLSLASRLNLTPLRLELWPQFDTFGRAFLDGTAKVEDYNRDRLNVGAIKVIADGSIFKATQATSVSPIICRLKVMQTIAVTQGSAIQNSLTGSVSTTAPAFN